MKKLIKDPLTRFFVIMMLAAAGLLLMHSHPVIGQLLFGASVVVYIPSTSEILWERLQSHHAAILEISIAAVGVLVVANGLPVLGWMIYAATTLVMAYRAARSMTGYHRTNGTLRI